MDPGGATLRRRRVRTIRAILSLALVAIQYWCRAATTILPAGRAVRCITRCTITPKSRYDVWNLKKHLGRFVASRDAATTWKNPTVGAQSAG